MQIGLLISSKKPILQLHSLESDNSLLSVVLQLKQFAKVVMQV